MTTAIHPVFSSFTGCQVDKGETEPSSRLRAVNAPIYSWIYSLLANTIDAFTA